MPGLRPTTRAALACLTLFACDVFAATVDVVEYYNASQDHYFISSLQADIVALDTGKFAGWVRTGSTFKAYSTPTGNASPVCRFYIPPDQGDSHFYSASPAECAQTASKFPSFVEESTSVMYVDLPDLATGACPAGDIPVYRLWDSRADSNHRYVTDLRLRDQMLGQGWVAEGYGPAAVILCAPRPAVVDKGQLLIQAWNPNGTAATITDFVNFTHYVTSRWSIYENYGVFPIGKAPATPQIGSSVYPANIGGVEYVAMDVPANQPFYFTAPWKAVAIGTVYMRADNAGTGFVTSISQPRILELPYEFALAEYQKARTLLPATGSLSPEAQTLLAQATAAIDAAKSAASGAARALAAYNALSFVMPLKERLVLDASNTSISIGGRRGDFDLNYEGFGSWTDARYAPGYVLAKDAGFQSVYTTVDWNVTSPTRGAYNFSSLDYQIDQAQKLGFKVALQVNPNVGNLPAWAKSLSFTDLKTVYHENARIVVARYGSRVSLYYACGELELASDPLTLDQLAELARQSLSGARAAIPAMPFGIYVSASHYVGYQMNPGPNASYYSGLDLLGYLSRNNINFDFVGLEMQYGTVFAPVDLQRFQEVLQDVHDVAKVPIYMGETGYSSKTEDYGIAASFFWHNGFTEQAQYEWADGTLRMLYAMPYVKGYYWVHVDPDDFDYGSDFLSSLVGTNHVRADGSVKKVHSAFKDFSTALKHSRATATAASCPVCD